MPLIPLCIWVTSPKCSAQPIWVTVRSCFLGADSFIPLGGRWMELRARSRLRNIHIFTASCYILPNCSPKALCWFSLLQKMCCFQQKLISIVNFLFFKNLPIELVHNHPWREATNLNIHAPWWLYSYLQMLPLVPKMTLSDDEGLS